MLGPRPIDLVIPCWGSRSEWSHTGCGPGGNCAGHVARFVHVWADGRWWNVRIPGCQLDGSSILTAINYLETAKGLHFERSEVWPDWIRDRYQEIEKRPSERFPGLTERRIEQAGVETAMRLRGAVRVAPTADARPHQPYRAYYCVEDVERLAGPPLSCMACGVVGDGVIWAPVCRGTSYQEMDLFSVRVCRACARPLERRYRKDWKRWQGTRRRAKGKLRELREVKRSLKEVRSFLGDPDRLRLRRRVSKQAAISAE